jgi:hypothetical protein
MGFRIGKKDGFDNVATKRVHDVGTRVISETKLTLHENVKEFNEERAAHNYVCHLV